MTTLRFADFTPNSAMSPAPRMLPKRNNQEGRVKAPKVRPSPSLQQEEEVKLHEAENAWKPNFKISISKKELTEKETMSEELYKKVRGILNKLTPQMFEILVGQVQELPIDNQERLKGVMELVFEQALHDPAFSVAYAKMCKTMAMIQVPVDEGRNKCVNFRRLLLLRCQNEFEKDWTDELRSLRTKEIEPTPSEEKRKEMQVALDEEERRLRKRSLGNIRFIGELYKLGMLTSKIMHECLQKLIRQGDEDSLECLCRLLATIGREMESEIVQKSKNSGSKEDMGHYFAQMQAIVQKRTTSSRVRFKLQDAIELRSCKWVPRHDDINPKTIDQIHKEAEREAIEQTISLQQAPPPMRGRGGGGGGMEYKNKGGMPMAGGDPGMGEHPWFAAQKPVYTRICGMDFSKLTKHALKVDVGNKTKDSQFVRALMTSVCEHIINAQGPTPVRERMKQYTNLLQRHLAHNDQLQLHSLYALQALTHRLQPPAEVLGQIFEALYDEEVVSEDAFKQWEQSTDPAEQEGKGVALLSVTQFFVWLKETEEDDEDS